MAEKMIGVNVDSGAILYSTIATSKNGYNYAELSAKVGDDEYVRVSYEWKSEKAVPTFALELMQLMKANGMETSGVWKGKEDASKEFAKRHNIVLPGVKVEE